ATARRCRGLLRPETRRRARRRRRWLPPLPVAGVLVTVVWPAWRHGSGHMSIEVMRVLADSHPQYGPLVFMAIVVAGLFTRVPMARTVLIAIGAGLFRPFRPLA